MTEQLVDSQTMADVLGVNVLTLRCLVRDGRITAYRIGAGPKANMRFDVGAVLAELRASSARAG